MGVDNKAPDVRYFTWYVQFPDGETKWRQTPFIHEIMFELKNLGAQLRAIGVVDHPGFEREILKKGEYQWVDRRKNKWLLRVEKKHRRDNWI